MPPFSWFGQQRRAWTQEHSGAVDPTSSLKVQYAYSTGINASRLTSMTYPNGRVLNYVYNTGLDSDISRLSEMNDAAGTGAGSVEAYRYLGLDTIVQRTDGTGTNQTALSYIKQAGDTLAGSDAGDQYSGLDRFGRVVDQNWIKLSSGVWTGVSTDRFQYGYDRDGNVLFKNNLMDSTFSELYHANASASGDDNTAYDNLNRLVAFQRGTLSVSGGSYNGGKLDTVSSLNSNSDHSQVWTLDAVGNQTSLNKDGAGAVSNTFDSQNEETGFGANTLVFDPNGNTTTDDHGHTLIYNAWNQLVQVKNGGSTLATYVYDASGNRIQQNDGTLTDLYNSARGQTLEERRSGTVTNQYVWSITYLNSPVLGDDNTSGGSYGIGSSGLGQRVYAQNDANFNVTSLEDTSGNVLQRFDYTPYGVTGILTSNWTTPMSTLSWVYTFQGGRADATVGMVHFGARDYSPNLARWVQKDPDGYIDGANQYEFVRGNSVSLTDSQGLDTQGDTRPSTRPSLFQIDAASGMSFAPITLDTLLQGKADSPGSELDLPLAIQEAIDRCVDGVQKEPNNSEIEWGASVAYDPIKHTFSVWGPAEGGVRSVNTGIGMPPINLKGPNLTVFGMVHVHPNHSSFSEGDVYNFLDGTGDSGFAFTILADCDGSHLWALVRYKSTLEPSREVAKQAAYSGRILSTGDPDQDAELYNASLNAAAERVHFAVYYSKRASGTLRLISKK
jgi:RHS repeat-associated protein